MNEKNNFGIDNIDLTDYEIDFIEKQLKEDKYQGGKIIETFKNHPKVYAIIKKMSDKFNSIKLLANEIDIFLTFGRRWVLSIKTNDNQIRYVEIAYSDLRFRILISDSLYEQYEGLEYELKEYLILKRFTDWLSIEELEDYLSKLFYMFGVK